MAKIEGGRVVRPKSSGNSEELVMGVTMTLVSFEHDAGGRPFANVIINNEGKMDGQPGILYMEDPLKDAKIADRASSEFRGNAKKQREDAKMKECVEGAVLYTDSGKVSKDKDGVYTIKAKYLDTISAEPDANAVPCYIHVSGSSAYIYRKEAIDKEVRGTLEDVINKMADAFEAADPETARAMTFTLRDINDNTATNMVTMNTYNKEAKRLYTVEEFIENMNKLCEKDGFKGTASGIIGERYSMSTLMEENKAHGLSYAFQDSSRGTPQLSVTEDGAVFVNGLYLNGVRRTNEKSGKSYIKSPVDWSCVGSKDLPELVSGKALKAESKVDDTPPPQAETPAAEDPLAPGARSRGPGSR